MPRDFGTVLDSHCTLPVVPVQFVCPHIDSSLAACGTALRAGSHSFWNEPMHGTRIAARDHDDSNSLAIEVIGDELVVFDPVRMHYHTLNAAAAAIWAACEDTPDTETAVAAAMKTNPALTRDQAIRMARELAELGLIQLHGSQFRRRINRRDAVKLSVAAFAGVVGLPVIVSITVPSSQAAATPGCPGGGVCGGSYCSVPSGTCGICVGDPCVPTACPSGWACVRTQCYKPCTL